MKGPATLITMSTFLNNGSSSLTVLAAVTISASTGPP